MDDCIFCRIIRGELPSARVYEDDFLVAFLDLFPAARGHTLLVPKKHTVNIFDTHETDAAQIYPALIKVANALKTATDCDGLNILQNNGVAAGQVVFHSHIHLVPRYENDGIKIVPASKSMADAAELAAMSEKIRQAF